MSEFVETHRTAQQKEWVLPKSIKIVNKI
jgi:hypothetical protein